VAEAMALILSAQNDTEYISDFRMLPWDPLSSLWCGNKQVSKDPWKPEGKDLIPGRDRAGGMLYCCLPLPCRRWQTT